MRISEFDMPPRGPRNAGELIAEITRATSDIAAISAAALARDIIAGEGATVAGRMHFSRTIDADDASLCARILRVAGRTGLPVSRQEADALFAIDAAGSERCDDGHFDDLLAKAVIHHLMAAAGADVPGRGRVLNRASRLVDWASAIGLARESRSWLADHLDQMKSSSPAARTMHAVCRIDPGPARVALVL